MPPLRGLGAARAFAWPGPVPRMQLVWASAPLRRFRQPLSMGVARTRGVAIPGTVLAASLFAMGGAVVYAAVGLRVARRGAARLPLRLFGVFWTGMAAYALLDASWALAVASWDVPLAVSLVVLHLKIVAAVTAFGGLVAYLLAIYTGRERVTWLVLGAYLGLLVLVTYFYVWRGPVDQHLTTWGASLDYARPGGLFQQVVVVLLFVPPALCAVAYAFLLRVVREPRARMRVLATSTALAVLFAGLTLGWLNGKWPWWGLAEKVLAIAAALVVLWTLREPATAA